MINENFKSLLKSIQLDDNQIFAIEKFISTNKARVNSDTIEYPDGSTFYSENFVKLMNDRAFSRGKNEGERQPIKHIAEIKMITCPECGYGDKI